MTKQRKHSRHVTHETKIEQWPLSTAIKIYSPTRLRKMGETL